MFTVNSLSGGKTSSYMAVHYPSDYNVFALVTIEDKRCSPKDKELIKWVSDKIGKEFIATAEHDLTLNVVRDLEQLIGKEIIWLTGISFDELIKKRKALPNKAWRFCTTEMKMRPIWDWWYKNFYPDKVYMNVGFRYDEKHRGFDIKTGMKKPDKPFKGIIGKHENGDNKWLECEWVINSYPLISNQVISHRVIEWAKTTNIVFPNKSNCRGCFWKPDEELRMNWEDEPHKMQWFSEQEIDDRTWKTGITYEKIKRIGLQQDLIFDIGSYCESGYCTD